MKKGQRKREKKDIRRIVERLFEQQQEQLSSPAERTLSALPEPTIHSVAVTTYDTQALGIYQEIQSKGLVSKTKDAAQESIRKKQVPPGE